MNKIINDADFFYINNFTQLLKCGYNVYNKLRIKEGNNHDTKELNYYIN